MKNAPRYYLCGECGREFAHEQGRCVDICGGVVRPVYSEDILNKEESDEEDLCR